MQAILGVIFHFIGGFTSFSFYVPFKKAVRRAWESYLIIGGIFSWIIVLFTVLYQGIPALMEMMGSFDSSAVFRTSFPAALLGIVGLTFGFRTRARCQGISLGQSVALAFCAAFGALMPFTYNVTFILIMIGGFTAIFTCCIVLNTRNKTFFDYTNKEITLLKNFIFSALAGTTWNKQFFYGIGESKLGSGASS